MYGVIILGYIIVGMIIGAFIYTIEVDHALYPKDYKIARYGSLICGIFWPITLCILLFGWLYRIISYGVYRIYYWIKEKTRN